MIKKIIVAAALAVCAASAYAAEPGAVYAGADAGSTRIESNFHKSSYGAFVGYQFLPNVAIEGGYRSLARYDFYNAHDKAEQFSLSAVANYPISESFSLYGRLGVGRLSHAGSIDTDQLKVDYKGNRPRLLPGIGASYKLTQKVSARLELQHADNQMDNLSAGISYSF